MKIVTFSNWTNVDLQNQSGYVTSYTIREKDKELFQLNLLKQMGFYQICEFTSPTGEGNFIIEQTNRVGTPKVAAFDKNTGVMLGAFKTNSLVDTSDAIAFNVQPLAKLESKELQEEFQANSEDFAALLPDNQTVAALYIRLPKHQSQNPGFFSRMRTMASHATKTTHDVMELVILEPNLIDDRMFIAVAVILHSRGGLQLN